MESDFILRVRPANPERGQGPACALFEADAGSWRLKAIENVKDWLTDELGDDCKVYG